ncbi:hypothetical protein [Arthrobacter wenxiniae]|uniref:Uncharacterized protein n=1 Tax=Arthrobacter wenxiniae TaxID=2713570 RepID=A0A7Y7IFI6_9MICC|nr:hypothetical protein [Arthrobacter wenxiniae]NVM94551.1 hypothetical protein [Arthrobacter wenxiniae]
MLITLLVAAGLAAALVLAVVRAAAPVRAGGEGQASLTAAARVDPLAMWAAVLVPSLVLLGWHNAGPVVLAPLGAIAVWFAYRVAAPASVPLRPAPAGGSPGPAPSGGSPGPAPAGGHGSGSGRGSALYHLILTAAAAWAAVSLADALGPHPASRQLGSLIQHVIAWIVLLLASMGWLLGAFATPGKPSPGPSRVLGVLEALLAATLAACFFTVS